MAFDLLIRNGTVVTSRGTQVADVGVREGRVVAVDSRLAASARNEIVATGLCVLPGVIDAHVHFRSPGLEEAEDWLSGTRAAVFGGVTTVLDMPNTLPPTDTVEHARDKLALAGGSAYCDFGIFGLLGEAASDAIELAESGLVVGLKAFLGPTTGGLAAPDDAGLLRVLGSLRRSGMRVVFHAEDGSIIARVAALAKSGGALGHLAARPAEAEVLSIGRVGTLLGRSGARGHIAHVSSAEGLAAVEALIGDGIDVTCEVTPHHALLGIEAYERFGALAKVNPPIRGAPHNAALLAALAGGRISQAGSDHAPHPAGAKQRPWQDAPAGIPGVETLLPLLLTEVAEGRLTLERLAQVTSEGPARAWGLWPLKGSVEIGADADLTLVDPGRDGVVRADQLHGKSNLTPFEGRRTRGAPVTTIVRGRVVMRDGALVAEPGWGKRVSRA